MKSETFMTSDQELSRIYDDLTRRIQHIGIALLGQRITPIRIDSRYDLERTDTPSIGEAEDAFMRWNCAILTAFRRQEGLTSEENFKRNILRNEGLKAMINEYNLKYRAVNGCYREANWEMPNVEICFFVTNIERTDAQNDSTREFFRKIYRLAEHYEQDCFLFTFPGQNRVAFLVATNDDGRRLFRDNLKFAGPLFTHVPDIGDWTDCSDGRISFRLKGMIQKGGTGNKKIKIGEGDIFDTTDEQYSPDGIAVVREKHQEDLKEICKTYDGTVPLVERYFAKEAPTADDVRAKVRQVLSELAKQKCKSIGFHCSVALEGSYVEGARVALDTIKDWAHRNDKKLKRIVIVDIYGDYSKALNRI